MLHKLSDSEGVKLWLQTHADYEHRLQEEVNARLLKEQELEHLVHPHLYVMTWCVMECM